MAYFGPKMLFPEVSNICSMEYEEHWKSVKTYLMIYGKKSLARSLVPFWSDSTKLESYKVLNSVHWVFFFLHFFKFYGWKTSEVLWCFDHFTWTYEVAKLWMIKLYLVVSDIIHTNELTQYANNDFHINFWNIL